MPRTVSAVLAFCAATFPAVAIGQSHDHSAGHGGPTHHAEVPQEPGQGAFAAISEIVRILADDPETRWKDVDIAALREHLVDMANVTLHAKVAASDLPGGARFEVTGPRDVAASVRRMVPAHAAVMDGVGGWSLTASTLPDGAVLEVTGGAGERDKIRALGFFGVMALGMHHQDHHLAIASGRFPH